MNIYDICFDGLRGILRKLPLVVPFTNSSVGHHRVLSTLRLHAFYITQWDWSHWNHIDMNHSLFAPEAHVNEMTVAPLKTFNISQNVTQVLVGRKKEWTAKWPSFAVFISVLPLVDDSDEIAEVHVTVHSSLQERYLPTVKSRKIKMKRLWTKLPPSNWCSGH